MKFQQSLMRLPVPSVEETCTRYLSCIQPLVTPAAYAETVQAVARFTGPGGQGASLQASLLHSNSSHPCTSYVADMWTEAYLVNRAPLPLNLNPQLTWRDDPRPGGMEQATRAAGLLHAAVQFHLALAAGVLPPDVYHTMPAVTTHPAFQRLVTLLPDTVASYAMYAAQAYPLDMSQYARLFSSFRLPRRGGDSLVTATGPVRHITVLRGSKVFSVDVLDPSTGRAVRHEVLASRLRAVLRDSEGSRGWGACGGRTVDPREAGRGAHYSAHPPVGALTGTHRDEWADARAALSSASAVNVASLASIDSSLLVLTLDDTSPVDHASVSRTMLHGDGRNRWFDKCLNFVVGRNGKGGVCWEHSWGDGVCVLSLFNSVHKAAGSLPIPATSTPAPTDDTGVQELQWVLPPPVVSSIRKAEARFDAAVASTRLRVYQSEALTKADIKLSRLSPDGVMQAVLQLAHTRAHGYTPVTYESASTAAFKHGRTEVIRSATLDSSAMCAVFSTRGSSSGARYAALQASTERHKALSLAAVMGKGVDRHLYALRTWAARLGVPPPDLFTHPSWSHFQDIRLSTSTLASDALDGGGFGPVNGHSYAVGYGVEERGSHFHVMSTEAEGASVVFPDTEPPPPNPAAGGYAPVDNDALCDALEGALVEVHDAVRKGRPGE